MNIRSPVLQPESVSGNNSTQESVPEPRPSLPTEREMSSVIEEQALQRRLAELEEENRTLEIQIQRRQAQIEAAEERERLQRALQNAEERRAQLQASLNEPPPRVYTPVTHPAPEPHQVPAVVAPLPQVNYKQRHAPEPKKYEARSVREYEDFVISCENEFGTFPDFFKDGQPRIQYGVRYLGRSCRRAWDTLVELGSEPCTWKAFKIFLINQHADESSRRFNAGKEYQEAKMRETQTIQSFVQHLESLETQIETQSEETKYRILLNKLPESIQTKLLSNAAAGVPTNKVDLIATVRRIQSMDPKFGKTEKDREKKEGKDQDQDSSTLRKRKDRSPLPNPRKWGHKQRGDSRGKEGGFGFSGANVTPVVQDDGASITCAKCGQIGHKLPKCPLITCFTCGKTGHIATYCPEKGSGKDRAQG
jgi:Zinc knuckle